MMHLNAFLNKIYDSDNIQADLNLPRPRMIQIIEAPGENQPKSLKISKILGFLSKNQHP